MLQPLQVNDVAVRYPAEIAELRDFLNLAGVPLGTPEVLGGMVARLQSDRGFHRDLMSNIWVVLDRCDRQISYSDLLGVLAVAAAGPRLASTADENDAHELLRFLMDARHALDAPSEARSEERTAAAPLAVPAFAAPVEIAPQPSLPPAAPVSPLPVAETPFSHEPTPYRWRAPEADTGTALSQRGTISSLKENVRVSGRSGQVVWAIAAAALIALCVGLWMYLRPAAKTDTAKTNTTTATAQPAATQPTSGTFVAPAMTENEGTETAVATPAPAAASRSTADTRAAHAFPYLPFERSAHTAPETGYAPPHAATLPATTLPATVPAPATAPAPIFRTPANAPAVTAVPAPVATTHLPVTSAAGGIAALNLRSSTTVKAPPPPVPVANLTRQLDSPAAPTDYAAWGIDSNGRRIPRLYRRQSPNASGNNALVATDLPPVSGTGHATPAGTAVPSGTVRPTSLGMAAAYIEYDPAPSYPVDAAIAHVQGPVKLQAEVDRNGNVASAYVISGPPLLRDAALDAVLHWRYKPYRSGGKPSAMTATAVLEFELP